MSNPLKKVKISDQIKNRRISFLLDIERRPIAPVPNNIKRPITRKPAIIPAKKGTVPKTQLNPAKSVTPLQSRSSINIK